MTDTERYIASASECEDQAKRSLVSDHRHEWGRLARAYRLLAEQVAVGGLNCSSRDRERNGELGLNEPAMPQFDRQVRDR
jgi:hypothetical protein